MKPCAIIATLFLAGSIAIAQPTPAWALPRSTDIRIAIVDFAFEPAEQTITSGDTITWRNDGQEPHNVIDADGAWESPTLVSGQSYTFTFATPGAYTYYCSIHSGMLGTIVVAEPQQQTKVYVGVIQR